MDAAPPTGDDVVLRDSDGNPLDPNEEEDRQLTAHHVTLLPPELLSPTPSSKDGVSAADERAQRLWACELVQEAGILLRLPQVVMCTAQNLVHRFYYRKSLASYDSFVVAMGCFFLACKVEEKPKRLREVLFVFHYVYKARAGAKEATLELGGARYNGWKDALVKIERNILKELGFSFYIIEHGHRFLLFYVKLLEQDAALAQCAWAYLNDSTRTDLGLRYPAQVICCACLTMAARKLGVALPESSKDGVDWHAVFRVAKTDLDAVSDEILALYTEPKRTWLEALCPGPRLTSPEFEAHVLSKQKADQAAKAEADAKKAELVREAAAAAAAAAPPPPPPPAKSPPRSRDDHHRDRDRSRRDRDRDDRDRGRRRRSRSRSRDRDDRKGRRRR